MVLVNTISSVMLLCGWFSYSNIDDFNWFTAILASVSPFGLFFSLIFLMLIIIRSLYTTLFSSQGYLTFSLPVSIDSILMVKIFISSLWIVIFICIILFWVFIILDSKSAFVLPNLHNALLRYTILDTIRILFFMFLLVIKPVTLVLFVTSILNAGKICHFKSMIGVILFILIFIVSDVIFGYLRIFLYGVFDVMDEYLMSSYYYPFKELGDSAWVIVSVDFLVFLIPISMYYCACRYLVKNKLEI